MTPNLVPVAQRSQALQYYYAHRRKPKDYPRQKCSECPKWFKPIRKNQITCGAKACVQVNRNKAKNRWYHELRKQSTSHSHGTREIVAKSFRDHQQEENDLKRRAYRGDLKARRECAERFSIRYIMVRGVMQKPLNETGR